MNYILKKLDQKINLNRGISKDKNELAQLLRVKIEYFLLLILGYLWNKNFHSLNDEETRQYITTKIVRPSLGTIVEICQKLDTNREIFCDKKLAPTFFRYTDLRNDTLGHGYLFKDKIPDYIQELEKYISIIENSNIDIIYNKQHIVYITDSDEANYTGISFNPDQLSYEPSLINKKAFDFEAEELYITENWNSFFKISPFVIFNNENFFLYRCIEEKLNGRTILNCIDKTGDIRLIWKEFLLFWEVSYSNKRISGNGTILNVYQNNYSNYIQIGAKKKKIMNFLENKSSVSATIWGHGGVGKTATIQSVCQDLSVSEKRKFDYILFLSAKDRFYNYNKAEIEEIDEKIDSYEKMISLMNEIIFDEKKFDEEKVINAQSKLLLIIDDFETFTREDQERVESFINKLDINYHKVIITTRISNLKIGVEIQSDELEENETKDFVLELIKSNYPTVDLKQKENELNRNYKSVYSITSGRPLFIYQFVALWMKTNDIIFSLSQDIKTQKNAIDFLYGRIYDSLEKAGKDVFDAISMLVNENDLSNLIDKLKYIINKEKEEDAFDKAIKQLAELLIIKIENNVFTVNSKEILEIMRLSFKRRDSYFQRGIIDRLNQVGRSKELDTDIALLRTADTFRTSRSESEVESIYRQILNRSTNKKNLQLKALMNLAEYWFNYRGNKEKAIKILEEYQSTFYNTFIFVKMLSNYYWSDGQKRNANNLLTKYFEANKNYYNEDNLELLGQIVIYKSITMIEERENLKSKKNYGEINEKEYRDEYARQKSEFTDIYNFYGKKLFTCAQKKEIDVIQPGTRQNIATGLYQLVDVCCRINKNNEAIEICDYAMECLPKNFLPQFERAKRRVNNYYKVK
jgi:hypothetical protein